MFPHIPPSSIAYDLSRTGSVEATTHNILAHNSLLPVPSIVMHTNDRLLRILHTTDSTQLPNHHFNPPLHFQLPQNPTSSNDSASARGYQKTFHRKPHFLQAIRERGKLPQNGVNLPQNVRRILRRGGTTWFYAPESKWRIKYRKHNSNHRHHRRNNIIYCQKVRALCYLVRFGLGVVVSLRLPLQRTSRPQNGFDRCGSRWWTSLLWEILR